MARQISFTKFENAILPDFRQRLNSAESTEDVRKFFVYTTKELFEQVFEGAMEIAPDDVVLLLDRQPHYTISKRISSSRPFAAVWRNSDLPRVVGRFAHSAIKRCRRLEKHPEKTDAKIRM